MSTHPEAGAIVAALVRITRGSRRPRSSASAPATATRISPRGFYGCLRARMDAVRPDTLMIIDTHWFTTGFHLVDAGEHYAAAPTSPTRCPGTWPTCPTTTPVIPNWRSSVRSLARSRA